MCVCVFITAVPMKKLFAWGDWCVCVSFNFFALVLSLYSSTGVAAQQVFAAENSGVSLLGKQTVYQYWSPGYEDRIHFGRILEEL